MFFEDTKIDEQKRKRKEKEKKKWRVKKKIYENDEMKNVLSSMIFRIAQQPFSQTFALLSYNLNIFKTNGNTWVPYFSLSKSLKNENKK